MSELFCIGIGIGTQNLKGEWLDTFYPQPELKPDPVWLEAARVAGFKGGNCALPLSPDTIPSVLEKLEQGNIDTSNLELLKNITGNNQQAVITVLEDDSEPGSVPESYLKLHLLSHRLIKPHDVNLNGLFGTLPNVAWTNRGPVDLDELATAQLQARVDGNLLQVNSVDKFPKMTDYVVPAGVRIAHTARVRLGAYLGEGTTIMHEGFVNFNAGTEGPGMIEGRISAGVFVGAGSDLGGGCSTMGTLSGGNDVVISIGKECLVGANAGVGIPLGDRCTIEAGLYITAGSVVTLLADDGSVTGKTKARELSGKSDLLFRRNSVSGAIECLTNKSAIELNEDLHANN
jgi:2,3,4,5-tetrahydropyridine-2-carboxylate N-succinyltransferase